MPKKTKTRRKVSHSSSSRSFKKNFPFKYFFVFAFVAVGVLAINHVTSYGKPSVLGVATSNYTSSKINWVGAPGLFGYNIYYKTNKDGKYLFSVRELPKNSTSYTINYLQKGKVYEYEVKGYDFSKKEVWSTGQKTLTTSN